MSEEVSEGNEVENTLECTQPNSKSLSQLEIDQNILEAIQEGNLDLIKSYKVQDFEPTKRLALSILPQPVFNYEEDTSMKIIKGPTALIYAIQCQQPKIVKYLLENSVQAFDYYIEGFLPIHYAAISADYHCLQVLLTSESCQKTLLAPCSFNSTSYSSSNALHLACFFKIPQNVILLTQPLPPFTIPEFKSTSNESNSIQNSSQNSSQNNIKSSKNSNDSNQKKGRKKNEENKDKIQIESNEIKAIDINSKGNKGNTPLHFAVLADSWSICQILLDAGADLSIKNENDLAPIDLALNVHKQTLSQQLLNGKVETEKNLIKKFLPELLENSKSPYETIYGLRSYI